MELLQITKATLAEMKDAIRAKLADQDLIYPRDVDK